MSATVRTAKKLLLGREIAHMIESTGLSQLDAAKLIETSQPRIASLINGGGNISPGDLVLLATNLGFTDVGYHEALRQLRRDNYKRGFWTTGHNRAYSEEIRLRIDLEKYADQLRALETEVVPGLLQCESYVHAMHMNHPGAEGVTLAERIGARLARQEILDKSEPPIVQFILSESCLRRVWGSPEIMREQLEYLVKLSNRPNIHIQVLPFELSGGAQIKPCLPFTLIRVPSPGAAGPLELAYAEGVGEIRYLDDRKALKAHEVVWAELTNSALKFEPSRKFIREIAREYAARS